MIKSYIFLNSNQKSELKYATIKFELFRLLLFLFALIGLFKTIIWFTFLLTYLQKHFNKLVKQLQEKRSQKVIENGYLKNRSNTKRKVI